MLRVDDRHEEYWTKLHEEQWSAVEKKIVAQAKRLNYAMWDDYVAVTKAKSWRAIHSWDPRRSYINWVFTILERVDLDWRKLAQNRVPIAGSRDQLEADGFSLDHFEVAVTDEHDVLRGERYERIVDFINSNFSGRAHLIARLALIEAAEYSEIADALDMRPSTVRSVVHRVRARIRSAEKELLTLN